MRRRKGNSKEKLILVVGLVMTLILGYRGYQAGWFENNGSTNNLGAVTASQTSDGKLVTGAKAVSSSTSSPQPIITVTSWPTFEMKLDSTNAENNLVVKAEYSVTAKGGKLFIPANWSTMSITNSLGQYSGNPTKVEMMPLDAASASAPCWSGSCYVIPQDKTIRFRVRQVYNPKTMFGGVYTGRLTYLHFSPVASYTPPIDPVTGLPSIENWPLYYKDFPSQTSKLNTVTVVGEKSPYVYTTSVITKINEPFTLKGVRLSGSYPFRIGSNVPVLLKKTDTEMTLMVTDNTSPGTYTFYLTDSVRSNSNNIQIKVDPAFVPETPVVLSPNGGETIDFNGEFSITFKPIPGKQNYVGVVDEAGGGHSYNISYAYTGGSWPIVGQNISSQTARFDGRKMRDLGLLISPSTKFRAMVCTDKGCDQSDNYFTLIDSYR